MKSFLFGYFVGSAFVLSRSDLLYFTVPGIYVFFGSWLIPKSQSIYNCTDFFLHNLIFYYNLLINLAAAYHNRFCKIVSSSFLLKLFLCPIHVFTACVCIVHLGSKILDSNSFAKLIDY